MAITVGLRSDVPIALSHVSCEGVISFTSLKPNTFHGYLCQTPFYLIIKSDKPLQGVW